MASASSSACRSRSRPPTPIVATSPPSARRWATSSRRSPTEMAGRAPTPRPRDGVAGGSATARFAVVAARFNEAISKKLADGAVTAFTEAGIGAGRVEVHWVPGSFELPLAALTLARSGRYAGIACVGVVIRGETPHFEYVSRGTAAGIREAGMASGVPIGFGVITANTEEQAWERAGGAVGNRGAEAALAVLEMAGWLRARRSSPRRR